jgi:hypothetical protein
MLESFPMVPVIGPVRISIAIFSYNGGLYFGVTGDYDSSPDIDVLTRGIEASMAGLLGAITPSDRGPTTLTRSRSPANVPPSQ